MAENIELLIQIQEQIIQCRRLAASVHDPKTARLLYDLANEIEQRAREADRAGRNKFATAALKKVSVANTKAFQEMLSDFLFLVAYRTITSRTRKIL
jgi:hypothetical protein